MTVSLTFETNAGEQVRAARGLIIRQKSGWFLHAMFLGFPVLLAVYIGFFDPDPRPWNWLFVFGLFAFCAAFLYVFPWFPVLAVRKGQRGVDGPHTVAFGAAGIQVTSPHSKAEFAWDAIVRYVETPEFLFIYLGKNVAQMIPKRALTPADLAATRAMLQDHIAKP